LSVLAETRPEPQDVKQEQTLSSPVTPVARTDGRNKRSKTMLNVEKTELQLLNNISKKMNHQDEDSDRSFLLSLVPDLKSIHENCKLDLKTEMLGLLKKYKNFHSLQSQYQNQPQY
jgi:hypothetical protein